MPAVKGQLLPFLAAMPRYFKVLSALFFILPCLAAGARLFAAEPGSSVAGEFYPASREELSSRVTGLIEAAAVDGHGVGHVFALISPHAGYGYSGGCAAYGYKLIREKRPRTVVVIGPSHHFAFTGVSVAAGGVFRTPLGEVPVDAEFASLLIDRDRIVPEPRAFEKEHSIETQLPFLQSALGDFKFVPVVTGSCSLDDCRKLGERLAAAIGKRDDVFVVVSTDLYHGYDYEEARDVDSRTLSALAMLDPAALYAGLEDGSFSLCGGYGAVAVLFLAKALGYEKSFLLHHTDSAAVTGNKTKGHWTVGYASMAIGSAAEHAEGSMLTVAQKKRLLAIARQTIEGYLRKGKKPEITEDDPLLLKELGAFVTLHQRGELRGCIGSMVGSQPLYLTIRDMAVESSTGDPRFAPVRLKELKEIEIEISVLSPLEKVDAADKITMGTHGVLVRRGLSCGVFLPQVATETGWDRDEFLSCLCSQKAGLAPDAWKNEDTELYTFTADVFSEKDFSR